MSGILDRLFPNDWDFGGPERAAASEKTAQIREELVGKLDQSGKELLETFCAAYSRESGLELKDAYAMGLCDGMELMMEYLRRHYCDGFSV